MESSSIPNLLSLKGGLRGGRGRLRGRGGRASASAQDHSSLIQGTDTDAAVSRLSAVEVGLLDDPFAQYLVQGGPGPVARRLPIINRGTYTRTTGLDLLIHSFLSDASTPGSATPERQIISLGAGTDTRSLRLFARPAVQDTTYHEIDFPTICTKKLNTVKASPLLMRVLPEPTVEDNGSWRSGTKNGNQLWCHGVDLRELPQSADDSVLLGLRRDIPTLLVSECCLCYLETQEAADVIKWFTDRIANIGILIYEPIKPNDAFGKTMVSNLAMRGIVMPTLEKYKERSDQEARITDAGFEQVSQMTVDEIWDRWVPEGEKERVNGLEWLDEVEEWKLLASHYIVLWGWRGLGFRSWQDL